MMVDAPRVALGLAELSFDAALGPRRAGGGAGPTGDPGGGLAGH